MPGPRVVYTPPAYRLGFELQFEFNAFKDKKDYSKPLCCWEEIKYWLKILVLQTFQIQTVIHRNKNDLFSAIIFYLSYKDVLILVLLHYNNASVRMKHLLPNFHQCEKVEWKMIWSTIHAA